MQRCVRLAFLPLILVLGITVSCTAPATTVLVVLDTDAPVDQELEIVATVVPRDGSSPGRHVRWVRGGPRSSIELPATFSVVPGDGPRNAAVTLFVDAKLSDPARPGFIRSFRRTAQFEFRPNQSWRLPIFISTGCLSTAVGCRTPGACTVAVLCDEGGLTCGDQGRCISREAVLMPNNTDVVSSPHVDNTVVDRPDVRVQEVFDVPSPIDVVVAGPDVPCVGSTACSGRCVNLNSDPMHCGRCGNACPLGQGCTNGVCSACMAPNTMCGAECANTSGDIRHCGRCGNTCATPDNSNATCGGGNCGFDCVGTFRDCDNNPANGCEINLSNSAANCGRCGNRCAAGAVCQQGACQCPAGQSDCGGTCRDTGMTCSAGVGGCARNGNIVCSGAGTSCNAVAGDPQPEVCNGVDDNCDGTVDEDPVCIDCLALPAVVTVDQLTHVGGDREFNGHGPNVDLSVNYAIAGSQVEATACVHMRETQSDWTEGQRCVVVRSTDVSATPITAILDGNYTGFYRDSNHSCDFVGGGPGVMNAVCVGDTSGDDICGGPFNCGATDCSGCQFSLSCVRVRRQGN